MRAVLPVLRVICVIGCWAAAVSLGMAQPVPSREPGSTHIFPAGGQQGTSVRVRIGTQCFPLLSRWRMDGAGVAVSSLLSQEVHARYEPSARREPTEIPISYSREWEATVEIAPDTEPGVRLWCITSARGGSGRRPFVIGELPELIESESNSLPDRAERVNLPVTVNGQIAGERDLDYFCFAAQAGQVVKCELASARLGSPLDPVLEIRDDGSQRMAITEQRIGCDPIVSFRAPKTGDYTLMISNLGHYGGPQYVYRATLTVAADEPDVPKAVETPINDSGFQATLVTMPVNFDGCFEHPGDEDWFQFTLPEAAAISITCKPQPAGSPTLPWVDLFDAANQIVATGTSVAGPRRQARIEWRSTAGGTARLRVRDLQQATRGGPEFSYRLQVRVNEPSFELSLPTDYANILPGSKLTLDVAAERSGGFNEAIDLIAEGLPAGVSVEPATIRPNESQGKLILTAADDARPAQAFVKIIGRATIEGQVTDRVASSSHQGHDADGISMDPGLVPDMHLTVQHRPVFRLFCNEAYQYGHRGSVYPYLMEIDRLDGFDGQVTLQIGDRQNRDLDGIEMLETVIPPGATQGFMPIYLPEYMHVNVQSQSQLYVQGYALFTDRWGDRQSLLVVSEKRNIIRTLPPVVKLKALDKEIAARPGATFNCHLLLERTSNFTGPMTIELHQPSDCFSAESAIVNAGETSAITQIHVSHDARPDDACELRFRARGQLRPDMPLISEAIVKVTWQ